MEGIVDETFKGTSLWQGEFGGSTSFLFKQKPKKVAALDCKPFLDNPAMKLGGLGRKLNMIFRSGLYQMAADQISRDLKSGSHNPAPFARTL